jgi:outer membrane autotransporter protein
MKKQLLGVALSALLVASAAEARFHGGFIGARAGYDWTSLKLKGTAANTDKPSFSPSGWNANLEGGYLHESGSFLMGGDVRVGYDFSSSSKKSVTLSGNTGSVEIKDEWNAGIGFLIGGEFARDWLGYFRLGLSYDNYKTNSSVVTGNSAKKFHAWAVVPGVGVKMKIDRDWSVDAEYSYSHAFSASNPSGTVKLDKKPTANSIKIGVSYYL